MAGERRHVRAKEGKKSRFFANNHHVELFQRRYPLVFTSLRMAETGQSKLRENSTKRSSVLW